MEAECDEKYSNSGMRLASGEGPQRSSAGVCRMQIANRR